MITIRDMVRAQAMLLDHLGIETLFCVVGGSMGGMQALQWAASYPERVFAALPIATAARHSAQNIAFHEVGRQAIMADPDWRGGRYLLERHAARARASRSRAWPRTSPISRRPRCTASSAAGCRIATTPTFGFDADFQVESYLRHQGIELRRPLRRQLLSLHHPRDGLFRSRRGLWRRARQRLHGHARRASASSPSHPTGCSRPTRRAPSSTRSTPPAPRSSFVEIETDKGHDAFLLDEPELFATMRGFLDGRRAGAGHPRAAKA